MFSLMSFHVQASMPVEIWFLMFFFIKFNSRVNQLPTELSSFFSKTFFCSASLTFWMHKFTELRSVNRHWEEHTAPLLLLLLQFRHCCMVEKEKTASLNVVDWRRNWIWHQETVVVVVAVLFPSSHLDTTVPTQMRILFHFVKHTILTHEKKPAWHENQHHYMNLSVAAARQQSIFSWKNKHFTYIKSVMLRLIWLHYIAMSGEM